MRLLLIVIAVFYFVPALKLLHLGVRRVCFLKDSPSPTLSQLQKKPFLLKVLMGIAQLEYHLWPFRSMPMGFTILIVTVVLSVLQGAEQVLWPLGFLGAWWGLAVLVLLSWLLKTLGDLKAIEFLRQFPQSHPEEFYSRYKLELAFGGFDWYQSPEVNHLSPLEADFRQQARARQSVWPWIRSVFDTGYMAHLNLRAYRYFGIGYAQLIFDRSGAMWGKRVLQHCQARFRLTGSQSLQDKKGRFLLIFNHKSSLDFVFTFFALSDFRINGREMRPRFIVAKDHFKDNPIFYSLLGIGKTIEAARMIFISRKNKKQSFKDLQEAAHTVATQPLDVTIYPQGTRAPGGYDRALKRRDAGYYTTINKKEYAKPQAHLKKGTAYLIWDTLKEMQQNDPDEDLNLVFIGIKGAGIVMPKSEIKIQTEGDVEFAVGDVVTLSPRMMEDMISEAEEQTKSHKKQFVQDMNLLIDDRLTQVLNLHQQLKQRYLTELKGQFRFDEDKLKAIEEYMDVISEQASVIYQILDRIYALPLPQWNGYLSQLSQLLLERTEITRLWLFCEEVAEEWLKSGK